MGVTRIAGTIGRVTELRRTRVALVTRNGGKRATAIITDIVGTWVMIFTYNYE